MNEKHKDEYDLIWECLLDLDKFFDKNKACSQNMGGNFLIRSTNKHFLQKYPCTYVYLFDGDKPSFSTKGIATLFEFKNAEIICNNVSGLEIENT